MKKTLFLALTLMLSVALGCAEEVAQALYPGAAIAGFSAPNLIKPQIVFGKSHGKRPQIGVLILAGVLGNILGSISGIYLGAPKFDEDHPLPFISYWAAGSALGSATAVKLAGHSRYWKGNFGMACIGGALGAGLSWLIVSSPTFQVNAGMLSLVPLLILPPIGAAIFYSTSLKSRRSAGGDGLVNAAGGRFSLGAPAIQVRPCSVPGLVAKPVLQFNVRLLSVEW